MNTQKRSPALVVVLTIVTCGIYSLFWYYSISDELKNANGDQSVSPGLELVLIIVTCGIYGIYWWYKYNGKLMAAAQARGRVTSDNGVLYIVLAIFGFSIVNMAILQNDLNNALYPDIL